MSDDDGDDVQVGHSFESLKPAWSLTNQEIRSKIRGHLMFRSQKRVWLSPLQNCDLSQQSSPTRRSCSFMGCKAYIARDTTHLPTNYWVAGKRAIVKIRGPMNSSGK